MSQRMANMVDGYTILDDRGARVFNVAVNDLQAPGALVFCDMNGDELCKIRFQLIRLKNTLEIEDARGVTVAFVQKVTQSPTGDRYVAKIDDGPDLDISGNIPDYEFHIMAGPNAVANISRRWFIARDSYGVEIAADQNDVLILATTVCIEQLSNPAK
jgi:uncharacterized protein YxjI